MDELEDNQDLRAKQVLYQSANYSSTSNSDKDENNTVDHIIREDEIIQETEQHAV